MSVLHQLASSTIARHFRCTLLLGSLQNAILLLCTHVHAEMHVLRTFIAMGPGLARRPIHM